MKKLIILTTIVGLAMLNQSCFENLNDMRYDGPPVVEFSNLSGSPSVNYSWSSTGSFWNTTINGAHADTALQVSLVGAHQKQSMEIGYYVADKVYRDINSNKLVLEQPGHDQWVLLETTAVADVDYTLLDNGIATITANSSFGKLRFSTSPTADHYMYIVLTKRDLAPSENYKIFRLRIRP